MQAICPISFTADCHLTQGHKVLGPHSRAVQILPEGFIYSLGGFPQNSEMAWTHPVHPFPASHVLGTLECNKFHFTVTLFLCCGKRPGEWDHAPEPPELGDNDTGPRATTRVGIHSLWASTVSGARLKTTAEVCLPGEWLRPRPTMELFPL